MGEQFTKTEEMVLNRIQNDIRIEPSLFDALASGLGMETGALIKTIGSLRERKVVRNISAIFNAHLLGYHTSLVAFSVPADGVERAAEIISAHPGVSHNYLRDHRFNIWFTLAAGEGVSLEQTVEALGEMCGAADSIILRNEKLYKIGFILKMGSDDDDEGDDDEAPSPAPGHDAGDAVTLTDDEKEAVRLLQTDLPLTKRPLHTIIKTADGTLSPGRLSEIGEDLKRRGIMRRYAAVLKHYHAGFGANAMTAWRVPDGVIGERAVSILAAQKSISHLYRRTVYPGLWEHPVFAMIHARSTEELMSIIRALEELTGVRDYLVLRSLREFKKQRVTYFSAALDEWNRKHLG